MGNDVGLADAGFEVDTNRGVLVAADGTVDTLPLLSKTELAGRILDRIGALVSSVTGSTSYHSSPDSGG